MSNVIKAFLFADPRPRPDNSDNSREMAEEVPGGATEAVLAASQEMPPGSEVGSISYTDGHAGRLTLRSGPRWWPGTTSTLG